MKIPEILNINATIPIIVHGSNRDIFSNANVIPTANASILVATASKVNSLKLKVSIIYSSSLSKLSRIMFNPIAKSRKNAIHGATVDTNELIVVPQMYPITGIINWKKPKKIVHNIKSVILSGFFV